MVAGIVLVVNAVGYIVDNSTERLIFLLLIVIAVYVAWRLLRTEPAIHVTDDLLVGTTSSSGQMRSTEPNSSDTELYRERTIAVNSDKPDLPVPDPLGLAFTIDSLKQATKDLVERLEQPLKAELRKARQSSKALDLLEHDLVAIIIRFGFGEGRISRDAASLYLELFQCLHPRTHSGWSVDNARDLLQGLVEKNPDTYLGVLKKPYTLSIVERSDSTHGTAFAKPTRDLLLAIAEFAGAADGKVSSDKEIEITQLKSVVGAPR
ncbi:MAG: hypothetical protein ABI811_01395 [Acidobacteriota bacterium]